MMHRTMDLGPFAGPIFATILVVECLFFLFLEWWIPREDLDYVPTGWDISSFKHSRVVWGSFATWMTRASLSYRPLRGRQSMICRCIQNPRWTTCKLEQMLCRIDVIPLSPAREPSCTSQQGPHNPSTTSLDWDYFEQIKLLATPNDIRHQALSLQLHRQALAVLVTLDESDMFDLAYTMPNPLFD
jgi:hypothetical protein